MGKYDNRRSHKMRNRVNEKKKKARLKRHGQEKHAERAARRAGRA